MKFHGENGEAMTFGNPVLLSVNETKLTTTLLSRVAMKE